MSELKTRMPTVAKIVDERRNQWGAAHVNQCIKAGMKGEPNRFFAIEAGHVVGTPFDAACDLHHAAKLAVLVGGAFVAMQEPAQ